MGKFDIDMVNRVSDEDGCVETYEVITQKLDGTGNFTGAGWFVEDTSVRNADGLLELVGTRIWRESDGMNLYVEQLIRGKDELLAFLDANIPG